MNYRFFPIITCFGAFDLLLNIRNPYRSNMFYGKVEINFGIPRNISQETIQVQLQVRRDQEI